VSRRRIIVCVALAAAVWPGGVGTAPAWGAPQRLSDERACMAALDHAKEQERTGSLLEAKDLLLSCARAPCAEFVRRQCAARHAKLEADTPTVVFVVTDSSGAARPDVQVRVDGSLLEGQLDGHPVEIDPGFHDFSFIANGHVFSNQRVLIVQGQRNRFVTAMIGAKAERQPDQPSELAEAPVPPVQALRPPVSTTPVRTARRSGVVRAPSVAKTAARTTTRTAANGGAPGTGAGPGGPAEGPGSELAEDQPGTASPRGAFVRRLPWVLAGVGVASLGAGALLTTWGRRDNDQLAVCSPGCNPSDVRHIRRLYLGADVAIGVGIAALAAGYWLYALGHGGSAGEDVAGESALRLELSPTRGAGGLASLSGRF
jgi:hypothetical protein